MPGSGKRSITATLVLAAVAGLQLQAGSVQTPANALGAMSTAVEALTRKVSPTVVQVLVSGYGPVEEEGRQNTSVIGRQHSLGSGVIVDSNGYIVTNAHVVLGAQRIRVVQTADSGETGSGLPIAKTRSFQAKIVGLDKNTDLAILKVEATGLPMLPIGNYGDLHQGQLVLAFGSPQGLENSVTMGVVSSVMRQPNPDRPMIYIQTDAAVNPGNSGGPLVDVAGNLVGLNTFILSQSGGNEGLGFAIPSAIVRFVYDEVRAHGHVHQRRIGVAFQTITPALAEGLNLGRDSGLIVADVAPGGPAATAGLRIQDVVTKLDGSPIVSLPMFSMALYRKAHGDSVSFDVLRGAEALTFKVPVGEQQQSDFDDLGDLADPQKSLVPELGVMAVGITPKIAEMVSQDLRIDSGVIVAARAESTAETALEPGDVIHGLNGTSIDSLEGLRAALKALKPGDAVALQLERDGKLMYLSFDLE